MVSSQRGPAPTCGHVCRTCADKPAAPVRDEFQGRIVPDEAPATAPPVRRRLIHNPDGTLYLIEPDHTGWTIWRCELAPVAHHDTLDAAINAANDDPYPTPAPMSLAQVRQMKKGAA